MKPTMSDEELFSTIERSHEMYRAALVLHIKLCTFFPLKSKYVKDAENLGRKVQQLRNNLANIAQSRGYSFESIARKVGSRLKENGFDKVKED